MEKRLRVLFDCELNIEGNLITLQSLSDDKNQQQTNEAFSYKWNRRRGIKDIEKANQFQRNWYLDLYGFENESNLASFLKTRKTLFDAGCGVGHKAAWFASLSPETLVIAMDFSDSVVSAAEKYREVKNLFFIQGDIADTHMNSGVIDYVSCDQVLQHTEVPEKTFKELTRIVSEPKGEFSCYVYAKKALPRELLDDYFRLATSSFSNKQIMELSEQLTVLGRTLSNLNTEIEVPDIPLLGIKGGKQDLQRFIYWNFIKCFWNKDLGMESSILCNFDWYSPSNAKRFSENEYKDMIAENNLDIITFHKEEACFSGRFRKSGE